MSKSYCKHNVDTGVVGCPKCEAEYRLANGIVDDNATNNRIKQLEAENAELKRQLDEVTKTDNCYNCGKPYLKTPICCECGTIPIVADDLKELAELRKRTKGVVHGA